MKISFLLSFLFLAAQFGLSQPDLTSAWAFSIGSSSLLGGEGTGGMAMDDEDNMYSILVLRDTTDLDPGPGVVNFIPQYNYGSPLVKYDRDGRLVWAHSFIGGDNAYGEVLEVAYDRMIVSASFTDSLIYDDGAQSTTLIKQEGDHVACILMDLNGQPIDFFLIKGTDAYFQNIITLPDQRILVAGAFKGILSFESNPETLISAGNYDGFIVMLNPDFSVSWAQQIGGSQYDDIEDIKVKGNRIVFSAAHEDTLHIQTVNGLVTLDFEGDEDGAFGTLDLNGNFLNVFTVGGTGSDIVRGIEIDGDGNLYTGGYFEGSVNFAGGNQPDKVYTSWGTNDAFIAKYAPNGDLLWIRIYTNNDYGGIYSLHIARGNEIYADGGFAGRADLNPGVDSLAIEEGYHTTSFLTKLNTDGEWSWSNWFRSEDNTGIRKFVVSTKSSRIYMNGYFYTSMNAALLPDTNYIYTHGQSSDAFFAAFEESGVVSSTHETTHVLSSVFPNPTTGELTIQADEEIKGLEIMSAGATTLRVFKAGSNTIDVNISTLPAGTYFIKLQFANREEIRKVIKL
ncbi:MAG: T9SS type A sorting domain-containing protein [Saprospiraceae bacterium]